MQIHITLELTVELDLVPLLFALVWLWNRRKSLVRRFYRSHPGCLLETGN